MKKEDKERWSKNIPSDILDQKQHQSKESVSSMLNHIATQEKDQGQNICKKAGKNLMGLEIGSSAPSSALANKNGDMAALMDLRGKHAIMCTFTTRMICLLSKRRAMQCISKDFS